MIYVEYIIYTVFDTNLFIVFKIESHNSVLTFYFLNIDI
jgi:hypothetical protein